MKKKFIHTLLFILAVLLVGVALLAIMNAVRIQKMIK